jgi:NAD(P)H dehydrogenase (quinone)
MIIVTGATGQLGHNIVKKLVARVPANQVGVSVRDPAKAVELASLGVRVRQGDFDNPESLRHAFEEARQILIVSSNARASGGDPLAQHRNAIEAAKAIGAKRIVYTSHMAVSASSAFPPMHDHAATEEMLRQSGLAWTALRHGFYASSGVMMMGEAFKTGTLETPADGKFSWAAHDDLAEAAAIILTDPGRYEGPTPPLTGSQALDFGDLALVASEAFNQKIQRKIISDDEMLKKLAARGMPTRAVDIVMGLYVAARNGEFAAVDPTLGKLLGRQPMSMGDVIALKAVE